MIQTKIQTKNVITAIERISSIALNFSMAAAFLAGAAALFNLFIHDFTVK